MSKWDMQKMKHPNYRRPKEFMCAACMEFRMRSTGGPTTTCAFDGRYKLWKASHFDCKTLLKLKACFNDIGRVPYEDIEREGRVIFRWLTTSDGVNVMLSWKRKVERGFVEGAFEFGLDGLRPMRLETAERILDEWGKKIEARALGVSEEDMAELRYQLGEDE